MKPSLLVIALLVCTTAHAADLAKWKKGDTTQVLTDERGTCIEGAAVIRVDGPTPRTGCYTLDEKKVYVVWSDASSEQLPIRKFRPTRETIAAAQKEQMERDEEVIRNGMDVTKQQTKPKPPPVRNQRPPPANVN